MYLAIFRTHFFFFALLAIPMILFLAGCGDAEKIDASIPAQVQPVEKIKQLPKSTFECAEEPSGKDVDEENEEVADYIIELKDAGRDCRRKLKTAGKIVNSDQSVPSSQ